MTFLYRCEHKDPMGLVVEGPVVVGCLAPPPPVRRARGDVGEPVGSLRLRFLVDTGATDCIITRSQAERLGLEPLRKTTVLTASNTLVECWTYRASVFVPLEKDRFAELEITASAMNDPQRESHFEAVLGRQTLKRCVLRYDGPRGCFELSSNWSWPIVSTPPPPL